MRCGLSRALLPGLHAWPPYAAHAPQLSNAGHMAYHLHLFGPLT